MTLNVERFFIFQWYYVGHGIDPHSYIILFIATLSDSFTHETFYTKKQKSVAKSTTKKARRVIIGLL